MRKVLIGTTNPSKANRFKNLLKGQDVEFITLNDLTIQEEPEENGQTGLQNAQIKVKFYGQYYDYVISADSGLYILDLPLNDPRQPGLHIRRINGKNRNDAEMLEYYTSLIHSLGGKVSATYSDAIAVYNKGTIYTFEADNDYMQQRSFTMVDTPHHLSHPGWPLDSISVNKKTGLYYVEEGTTDEEDFHEEIIQGEYRKKLITFLESALDLK